MLQPEREPKVPTRLGEVPWPPASLLPSFLHCAAPNLGTQVWYLIQEGKFTCKLQMSPAILLDTDRYKAHWRRGSNHARGSKLHLIQL